MRFIIPIISLVIFSNFSFGQTLHLYGGENNKQYLGCLNCNNYDSDSIWNEYGTYGSSYNSNSIWNEYGTYGNKYNSYSPLIHLGTNIVHHHQS